MKVFQRTIALIFVLIFSISILSSCKPKTVFNESDISNGTQNSTTNQDSNASTTESNDGSISNSEISTDSNIESITSTIISALSNSSGTGNSAINSLSSASNAPITNFDLKGKEIIIKANWYVPDKFLRTTVGKDINARATAIGKKFNCKIKFVPVDWGTHTQMMSAGQPGCDILCIGSPGLLPFYYKNKMLYPLNDLGIDFNASYFDKAINANLNLGGKQIAIKQVDQGFEYIRYQSFMYFNKNILAKRGIDPESIYTLWKNNQWTWSAFETMAKKVSAVDANNDGKPDIYGTANTGNDAQLWTYLIQSNGTDVVKTTKDGIRFNIDNPKAIKALDFWKKMAAEKTMYVTETAEISFTAGQVAFIGSFIDRIENQQGIGFGDMKDDYGVVPFPMGPDSGNKYNSYVSYFDAYSIPAVVLKKDDANHTYAKQLATIINEMCKPLYTAAKEKTYFNLQVESIVRDQGSADVLNAVKSYRAASQFYQVYESCLHPFYSLILAPKLAKGTIETVPMVQTYLTQYNKLIIDDWTLSK